MIEPTTCSNCGGRIHFDTDLSHMTVYMNKPFAAKGVWVHSDAENAWYEHPTVCPVKRTEAEPTI